jgi:hypothetical protein
MELQRRIDRNRLELLLAKADPLGGQSSYGRAVSEALDAMGIAITQEARLVSRPTRGRRRRRASLLAVVLFAVLTGVAYAAAHLFVGTDTGRYEQGPAGGEELNLAGTNFMSVALRISSDIPYPPGYRSWRTYLVRVEDPPDDRVCPAGSSRGCKMLISSGVLARDFARSAFCAWVVDWRVQTMAGNHAAAGRDARAIAAFLKWKVVVAADPHPTKKGEGLGDERGSVFGWTIPYIRAVKENDLQAVDTLVQQPAWGWGEFFLWDPVVASKFDRREQYHGSLLPLLNQGSG